VAWGSSEDGTLVICDVAGKQPHVIPGPRGYVDLYFTPDGQILVRRRGGEGVITLRELATGKEQPLPQRIDDNYSTWAVDRSVTTGSGSGPLRVWNTTGQLRTVLEGHTDRVKVVSYAPDGELLASAGNDSRVIIWDLARRKPKVRDWLFPGPVAADGRYRLAWSPEGRHLATVNGNGTVYVLRLPAP
jgi:WD40 repeat protein